MDNLPPHIAIGAVLAGLLIAAGFVGAGTWLIGALVGGAVVTAVGVAITRQIESALPFAAGGAALGIVVQVLLRLDMWLS